MMMDCRSLSGCARRLVRLALWFAMLAPACPALAQDTARPATVERVALVGDESGIAIAITASRPVSPQTRVLEGPDRIVIDFPNSQPGSQLHGVAARRGELKGVRVGLFASNPPTTRVVLDLSAPGSFQVFPSGNTVVVTLGDSRVPAKNGQLTPASAVPVETSSPAGETVTMGNGAVTITRRPVSRPAAATDASPHPAVVAAAQPRPAALNGAAAPAQTSASASIPMPSTGSFPAAAAGAKKNLAVDFSNGQLSIDANGATLSEVLYEVQRCTGADVAIPAGAERDKVVIRAGPGPAKDVMAQLLNGSRFNFIVVGTPEQGGMRSVILTPKTGGVEPVMANEPQEPEPDTVDVGVGDGAPAKPQPARQQPPH